jgi:hypothetical protein
MPLANPHSSTLGGPGAFAALYRMSPVGLKLPGFRKLTDEQRAVLHRIARDVVSQYPHAGIAPVSTPRSEAVPILR